MKTEQIGPLQCLVKPAKTDTETCMVMFHGYGADASDLGSLSGELGFDDSVTWVFPNGILDVPIGPMWMGKAWFPIDVQAMEQAMASGTHRDMSAIRPPGLDKAAYMAGKLIRQLQKNYDNVIWGGFSQGAMLSTELCLKLDKKPKALVLLSGTLLDEQGWSKAAEDIENIELFQSHGRQDQLLSYAAAERLHSLLTQSGFKGEFHGFKGGHEIPVSVLRSLKTFLGKQIN